MEHGRISEDELVAAQDMADWFPDYLYAVINEPKQMPALTVARLQRQFGEGEPSEQIALVRDTLMIFDEPHQVNLALYFCGYPKHALAMLANEEVTMEESLMIFDARYVAPEKSSTTTSTAPVVRHLGGAAIHHPISSGQHNSKEILKNVWSSRDSVDAYYRIAHKYALLTAEQEVELAKDIEAGLYASHLLATQDDLMDDYRAELQELAARGGMAKTTFVNANLRLVISIAKKFNHSPLPLSDLIQEGNIGLLRAVEGFDYMQGFKFSTYATWWIRQSLQRAIANSGYTIRIPVHEYEKVVRMKIAEERLVKRLGRIPSVVELADELDMTSEQVERLIAACRLENVDSLNRSATIGHDHEAELGDFIVDITAPPVEQTAMENDKRRILASIMDRAALNERQREVIVLRCGLYGSEPKTLDAVGVQLGVTRERVRQLEGRAMEKLRLASSDFDVSILDD